MGMRECAGTPLTVWGVMDTPPHTGGMPTQHNRVGREKKRKNGNFTS